MVWLPIGPDDVFSPRDANFKRLSLRNEYGRQGLPVSIAVDPTDPATIYLAERPTSGGSTAFRTRDGGQTWTPIVDELQVANADLDPYCIAVNPAHPEIIYLGTYWDGGGGVYVSSNRGEPGSWSARNDVGGRVKKLIVDSRTAGTPATTVLYAATDSGIFRSADGGVGWAPVIFGDVWSLVAFTPPVGTAHFYAGIFQSGVWYASAAPENAAGWTNLNAAGIGLPPHSAAAGDPGNVDIFLVDFALRTPTRAYAWGLKAGTTVGLYQTSAPAVSWTQVAIVGTAPAPWYGFYALSFAVAPNSPGTGSTDILLFGSGGISRSIDSGQHFIDDPVGFHADQHAIAFAPVDPGATVPATLIGCDGGIAKSTRIADPAVALAPLAEFNELDNLTDSYAWQNLDHGKQSSAVYQLAANASAPALAYIGCQDTGVNGRTGDLLWRGLADADGGVIAFAVGPDKVAVWGILGEYNGYPTFRVCFFADHGEADVGPTVFVSIGGSLLTSSSNYCVAADNTCILGAVTRKFAATTFTAAVMHGAGVVVTPASMANIIVGKRLAVLWETVNVTAVTATTFTATFILDHGAGETISPEETYVARVDRDGTATQISAELLGHGAVKLVARHPTDPNFLYCSTEDKHVLFTNMGAAAGPATVWTDITVNRPAAINIMGLTVAPSGQAYVLGGSPVMSGGISTPLFSVGAGGWTAEPVAAAPPEQKKILTAHPVANDILFAAAGSRVYTLNQAGGTWTWTSISDGLPGPPIYDLWAGNIGSAASPKVLLRAALPTRGIFERDVTAGAVDPALDFYLRDNILDTGWLTPSPEGMFSPYDGTSWVTHYQCADIKIDVKQVTSSPAIPRYLQTEPETPVIPPLDHVLFQQLKDASQTLPQLDQGFVHVQVHNRTAAPSGDVSVWAIYCSAATHVAGLNESASMGNAFPFWSQFHADGTIHPALPADSPWTSVGAPMTLNGLDAAHPKVASWPWTIPALASGDPGHYCMVAFVHGPGALIGAPGFVVDVITPANRQIGQKNLHIGPPLPPGGGPGGAPAMHAYVEFRNPMGEALASDVLFDLRALPPGLKFEVQFTPLDTVEPFQGLVRTDAKPLVDAKPKGGCGLWLASLLRIIGIGKGPKRTTPLPLFAPQVYSVQTTGVARIRGLRLGKYGKAAAFLSIRVEKPVEPGEYRFDIQQRTALRDNTNVVGGNTYVVNISGSKGRKPYFTPSVDLDGDPRRGEKEKETDIAERAAYLPPWLKPHLDERAIENGEELPAADRNDAEKE